MNWSEFIAWLLVAFIIGSLFGGTVIQWTHSERMSKIENSHRLIVQELVKKGIEAQIPAPDPKKKGGH